MGALIGAVAILGGCGYRLAGDASDPLGPFAVDGALGGVAYPEAHRGAVRGATEELARAGELAPSSGGTARAVVRVEVVRVEIRSGGIAAAPGDDGAPRAGSLRIEVTGRGRVGVVEGGGDPRWVRDTGDVVATDELARPPSDAAFLEAREMSIEATSRRLGQRIAQRLLWLP